MNATLLDPPRLAPGDLLRASLVAVRARPLRTLLSAAGIALGVATMIAVVAISSASRSDLMHRLDGLGTNLLTVKPGHTLTGEEAKLPRESVAMVRAIPPVSAVSAVADLGVGVYRNDRIPEPYTAGITVRATTLNLLQTLQGRITTGTWLTAATGRLPTVVLGAVATRRLGVATGDQVWLAGQWFTVLGTLEPLPFAPGVDRSALVGWEAARRFLDFDGHPTTIYERSSEAAVGDVRAVLARTVDPEHPEQVDVSRPSDALAAQAAASSALRNLLLGLGAVALLVGGVGVANTMLVSVLERRREIGLRRALGATRGHIRLQFLTESSLLSLFGAAAGTTLGAAVAAGHAAIRGVPPAIPLWAPGAALAVTLCIGAVAGIYPAVRAARLSPAVALTGS